MSLRGEVGELRNTARLLLARGEVDFISVLAAVEAKPASPVLAALPGMPDDLIKDDVLLKLHIQAPRG